MTPTRGSWLPKARSRTLLAMVAALSLARRLAPLPERAMRLQALAHVLRGEASQAVLALEELGRGALAKDTASRTVYASLVDPRAVRELVGAAQLGLLVQAALALETPLALLWLRACADEPLASEKVEASRLVHRDLSSLSLGERRALARRARGDLQKKLVCDPDPQVVTHLLANPSTTEATALAISSRRPTISAPLEAVLASKRFGVRYRVRLALCKNPYLRRDLAVALLFCLERGDLEEIGRDQSLSVAQRAAAAVLLQAARSS